MIHLLHKAGKEAGTLCVPAARVDRATHCSILHCHECRHLRVSVVLFEWCRLFFLC
jgi:hypothetical protein